MHMRLLQIKSAPEKVGVLRPVLHTKEMSAGQGLLAALAIGERAKEE